ASLTSGPTLTIVWAAEAAILAWLARRIAEPRFQLASLAWLGLAFAHGLAFDAPLARLFEENSDAWRAAPSAVALAVATALVGLCTFSWTPSEEGLFSQLFSDLLDAQPWLRRGAFALAGVTAVYAGSLAIVSLPASWDRGLVLVYDVPELAEVERSWAFAIVALAAIIVAVALELRSRIELEWPAVVAAA